MIVFHRGAGGLVLVAGVVAALAMNVLTAALFDNNYYAAHVWPFFGTLWLAGFLCFAMGAYFRKHPSKVKDQDWVEGEAADHLFFIPIIYWSGIFFGLGIVYLVYRYINKK